jgi:hypothetical protein
MSSRPSPIRNWTDINRPSNGNPAHLFGAKGVAVKSHSALGALNDNVGSDRHEPSLDCKMGSSVAAQHCQPHHMSFIDFSWNRTRTKEHQSEEVFFDVKLLNMLRQASPRFVVWPWSC